MWKSRKFQFIRFLFTGVFNTLVGWIIFSVAVLFGAPILLALVVSTTLGAVFNFVTHGAITFGNLNAKNFPSFLGVYSFVIASNYGMLLLVLPSIKDPLLAQILIAPFIALLSYFILNRLVFNA